MVEDLVINLIDKVGVAAAAFIMMYTLYVQNQKWQQKQQEKTEVRFDNLVDRFITTTKEITEKHVEALDGLTTKIDNHLKQKDQFIEFIKEERRQGT